MKAILMSIKPKWVAKILNGEKTIEVRKSMPKCDLPIDVYIYCTKDNSDGYLYYSFGKTIFHDKYVLIKEYDKRCIIGNGKVVAKFTLNKTEMIRPIALGSFLKTSTLEHREIIDKSCLTENEIRRYLTNMYGYAWHISNLVIFDKPMELGYLKNCQLLQCCYKKDCYECIHKIPIKRPPQSWQYAEVE